MLRGLMLHARAFVGGLKGSVAVCCLAFAAPVSADDLRDALASAYATNPALNAARADTRAGDEEVPLQRAPGLPSLNATVTHVEFVRQSANQFTAPERNLGINGQLLVPIYSGGGIKNATFAAKERSSANRADLRGVEAQVFSQVVAAYMDVLRTEALAQLAANQVSVLETNLMATSSRYELGDVTLTDVAQSRSRLAVATGDLRTAEANVRGAHETYLRFVGKAPAELSPPPPMIGFPETIGEAVTIGLENNPDLIAAKERAAAAGFETKAAGSGRLPSLSAFANLDYSDFFGTLGGPIAADFVQAETTANVGVRLTIPLFNGGAVASRQRQASARETSALENVIAVERNVIEQVRASYANWQASKAVIESSLVAEEAAKLSLEGVRAENSIGNRTILDVLNAEQELLQSRVNLITARRNAYVAGFSLLAAMGRAEARDLNLDTGGPLYDPMINYDRVSGKVWDWDRDPDASARSRSTFGLGQDSKIYGPAKD